MIEYEQNQDLNVKCAACKQNICHDGYKFCCAAMKENSFYKNNRLYKGIKPNKKLSYAELEAENTELKKKNTALRQDWDIMNSTIADYNDFCDKYIELEKQNENLQTMLQAEREVRCNDEYLKKVTELEVQIEELENENAELKERNRELLESCEGATMMYKDLCKAKEIIKELIDFDFLPDVEITRQAEQFLSEVKK